MVWSLRVKTASTEVFGDEGEVVLAMDDKAYSRTEGTTAGAICNPSSRYTDHRFSKNKPPGSLCLFLRDLRDHVHHEEHGIYILSNDWLLQLKKQFHWLQAESFGQTGIYMFLLYK